MSTPQEELDDQISAEEKRKAFAEKYQAAIHQQFHIGKVETLPAPYDDFYVVWHKSETHGLVRPTVYWKEGLWHQEFFGDVTTESFIREVEKQFPGGKIKGWNEIIGDPKVTSMNFVPGKLDITLQHEMLSVLASIFAKSFDSSGAKNYTETQGLVEAPTAKWDMVGETGKNVPGTKIKERIPITITIQHRWGLTPHELRKQALDALQKIMAFVPKTKRKLKDYQDAEMVLKEYQDASKKIQTEKD